MVGDFVYKAVKYTPNISKVKFKKFRKKKNYHNGLVLRKLFFYYGTYALCAQENGFLQSLEIEACRKSIVRHLNRQGNLWIHCQPYKPNTAKGSNARMGTGRGNISKWTFPVKKGEILFELANVSLRDARFAFTKASFKLSVKTKFFSKI